MPNDKEILQEVWDGKIPICFRLSQEDIYLSEANEIYLMVSRQTYFPLVLDKVHKHFLEHINPALKSNEMWLEFNGLALKWHYPIGLLYDLYVNFNDDDKISHDLPWLINVHFNNFPEEELLHCTNRDTVEAHFMSTVKEAASLKNKGEAIHDMQEGTHKQLWLGLQNDNFEQFWSTNKRLMETSEKNLYFNNIPFRIYQPNRNYIQKLFDPQSNTNNDHKRTLRDLLESIFNTDYLLDKKIIIQGIRPSLNTPIQWLSEHLSYPDNFMHIVIK